LSGSSATKNLARAVALLLALGLAAACSSYNNTSNANKSTNTNAIIPPKAAQTASPVVAPGGAGTSAPSGQQLTATIGAAFSLTGAAAQYGATQKNGAQLAVDQINAGAVPGLKLTLDVEDDASTKDQAITVFQKFITQDKVNAVMGPTLSNSAQAADPIAQQAKVPVLGVSNTGTGITDIGDYIFRDSLSEADVVPQAVQKAQQKLGFKTVAILYANDDAFSTAGYQAFKSAFDSMGIKIVDTETVGTNDKDFSAQLTKIKAANPDAIAVETLIDAAVGITTQARQLGLKQPIIGGNGFNSPAFIQRAGQAAEGVIVGAAWNAGATNAAGQKFIADYKAKYGSDPDQFAAQAYTGVFILAQAMRSANSTEHTAIRDALAKIQNFPTVLGNFSFNDKRDAQHQGVVQVVQNGQFVPLT
jgi:branched-chain amino acid transport system substrate-binding protein